MCRGFNFINNYNTKSFAYKYIRSNFIYKLIGNLIKNKNKKNYGNQYNIIMEIINRNRNNCNTDLKRKIIKSRKTNKKDKKKVKK